jgi:hypothetical protein
MDLSGLKRKDTTKGPPLRILSLGQSPPDCPRRLVLPRRAKQFDAEAPDSARQSR